MSCHNCHLEHHLTNHPNPTMRLRTTRPRPARSTSRPWHTFDTTVSVRTQENRLHRSENDADQEVQHPSRGRSHAAPVRGGLHNSLSRHRSRPGVSRSGREVREDASFTGGLIVHLGCGDGRLTAALGAGRGCLVHGLDTDAAIVEALYISMLDGCILCMGDVSE